MRYLSVCSGIEAASVAWHPLGWTPAAFSEIEPFPRVVLKERWPDVPLHGDFTTIGGTEYGSVDLLVGGTPCQSFSVAGLRRGLADERGNLALEFLRLAERTGARWVVWENVPGVLSSSGGRDFGAFLGGLAELGYGFAYRVLDAQYIRVDGYARAVPQRRRRVFVVGHLGDWRRAAAVLFERESLSGHPAPRREARESAAPTLAARTRGGGGLGTDFDCDGGLVPHVSPALKARDCKGPSSDGDGDGDGAPLLAVANTLAGYAGRMQVEQTYVAHSLRADGFDASEDGTGRGTPLLAIDLQQVTSPVYRGQPTPESPSLSPGQRIVAFSCKDHGQDASADISPTLRSMAERDSTPNGGGQIAVAFDWKKGNDKNNPRPSTLNPTEEYTGTLGATREPAVQYGMAVRRLTPRECERLQGFPDDYTLVSYRKKSAADGPRYKALGNSMAVNCMRWIGLRIAAVELITQEKAGAA